MPDSSYTPTPPPEAVAERLRGPSLNGPPADPPHAASWREVLLNQLKTAAASAALLAAVWACAFLVLLYLFDYGTKEAVGFACLAALIGAFFVRSFIPAFGEKPRPAGAAAPQHLDSTREVVETVVFVVVLVLMLKSFVAEAFVIPTGSMAETLYGYQTVVQCPKCQIKFPVNASGEVEGTDTNDPSQPKRREPLTGCYCPNCLFHVSLTGEKGSGKNPGPSSGDRVLVAKYVYEFGDPRRLDVVVFKFPGGGEHAFPEGSGPVKAHVPINYIKRLVGLPGETVVIYRGKLYTGLVPERADGYPNEAKANPAELWQAAYMRPNDEDAIRLFNAGQFAIVRKPPEVMLAMRRLVYDNDHQASDLPGDEWQRWASDHNGGWAAADDRKSFTHRGGDGTGWLRYRHVLRGRDNDGHQAARPQLITDFMGYNTYEPKRGGRASPSNWAGDLLLECSAKVERLKGELLLELSKGPDRFQAVFDLEKQTCSLFRVTGEARVAIGEPAPSGISKPGTYQLRFANVDDRLTVWVDGKLPFEHGVPYEAAKNLHPHEKNDLEQPVSIGSRGAAVSVDKLKLFRDTYYTHPGDKPDWKDGTLGDASKWSSWDPSPSSFYVQPGHYLCLGDNSPESSDGRNWGLVPRRLLLGKALLVYYPFGRAGRIR